MHVRLAETAEVLDLRPGRPPSVRARHAGGHFRRHMPKRRDDRIAIGGTDLRGVGVDDIETARVGMVGPMRTAPFIFAGIPSGGLSTGAEGIKTAAEAALWGGTAGQQYDPCYHLACDTYDNVNLFALGVNADAVAYAVLQFAMSTQAINGKRAKGNFKFDYWGPQPKE
jgi:hypothetical protein